jgi:hypothetical protein
MEGYNTMSDQLTSKEHGSKLVNAAVKADSKSFELVQKAGIYASFHACVHGDTSLMNDLSNGLTNHTRISFTAFINNINQTFGTVFDKSNNEGLKIAGNPKSGQEVRAQANENRKVIADKGIDCLTNIPWLSDKQAEKIEQGFDVLKGTVTLLKKIEKKAETQELTAQENVIYHALTKAQEQLANLDRIAA